MSKKLIGLVVLIALLGPAQASLAQWDPDTDASLVGWWKLDETLGATAGDSSMNGNDGTVLGDAVWGAGHIDGCLQFDGANDYVDLPIGQIIQTLSSATFAVWANYSQLGGAWQRLFDMGTGETVNMFLTPAIGGSNTGQLRFAITTSGNGAESQLTAPNRLPSGWHHIAVVINGDTKAMQLYVDAAVVASNTTNTLPQDLGNTTQNWLGRSQYSADAYYRGSLDDFRIYSRALSAQEIRVLVPPVLKATNPAPADGAIGVDVPLLTWDKGETALLHNVYLGTSPDLTAADLKASRVPVTLFYNVAGWVPGQTYYWRVDEIEKDGVTIHTGDVWTFMAQDVTAYYPVPADKANTVWPNPTLTWMSGAGATSHHVYFADSSDAVSQGAAEADQGARDLGDETFTPDVLESLTTYYWRVDEILAGGTTVTGPVWQFTTVLPLDDFESYNDEEGQGTRIYETWIDGWTNGTGSTVGNTDPPFAEQTIVHAGLQSMPLDYNNVVAPFYSEAEREFAPAEDWTAGGADTLILYVRGKAVNPADPLYVRLEDASQHGSTVTHPDPAVLKATTWVEWKIPLQDFTGVNLSAVKKLYLGVGDREQPQASGAGRLYIDDIALTRP